MDLGRLREGLDVLRAVMVDLAGRGAIFFDFFEVSLTSSKATGRKKE